MKHKDDRVRLEMYTKKYWKDMTPKAKLTYFFDYYTWHTVIAIAALIIIISTIVSIVTHVDTDMYALYVGSCYIEGDQVDAMENDLSKYVTDLDGDKKNTPEITPIFLTKDSKGNSDSDYAMAMQQKLSVELASGSPFLFILSPEEYAHFKDIGLEFVNVKDVSDKAVDGVVVKKKDSKLAKMESFKAIPDDYLIGVSYMDYPASTSKKKLKMYENTIKTFKELIR
ncbi:MAG: hypothetical protein Q8865_05740 [Bacillota bacterium]|nr:hypothetical protein [Bacillota bacterium]